MINKAIRIFGFILVGFMLFGISPFITYAQYQYGPTVSTINATNITPMNTTFNGTVNTGGATGSAWFEYGTDVSFGNSTIFNSFNLNNGYAGNFSTNVTGLTANTTYYFRAVAQNAQSRVYGNVISFTTNFSTSGYNNSLSPTAVTTSGTVLADNTAEFNGLILTGNINKADTWFEWGETPDLGNQTVAVPVSGAPAIRHTNTITGLTPNTIYYFRAVTQNSYGINRGDILSLKTSETSAISSGVKNNMTKASPKITSTDTTTLDNSVGGTSAESALGANVSMASSFLPVNLLGWLILIILILILILLGKHAHGKLFKSKK